jgi:hypothetical protein
MEFYRQCNHTLEDATNYTAMFNKFIEFDDKYPPKFVEARHVLYFGAWGGLRHLAHNNLVSGTVVKFNRRT